MPEFQGLAPNFLTALDNNEQFTGDGSMPGFALSRTTAVFLLLALAGVARAELIIQNEALGFGEGAIAHDLVAFQPFDPDLGELNEAVVQVFMNLFYTIQTAPVQGPDGVLLPTDVGGTATIAISGLGWPFAFSAECVTVQRIMSGTVRARERLVARDRVGMPGDDTSFALTRSVAAKSSPRSRRPSGSA